MIPAILCSIPTYKETKFLLWTALGPAELNWKSCSTECACPNLGRESSRKDASQLGTQYLLYKEGERHADTL